MGFFLILNAVVFIAALANIAQLGTPKPSWRCSPACRFIPGAIQQFTM